MDSLEPVWINVPHLESKWLCVITQPQLIILSFPLEGWIFSKYLKLDGNILSHYKYWRKARYLIHTDVTTSRFFGGTSKEDLFKFLYFLGSYGILSLLVLIIQTRPHCKYLLGAKLNICVATISENLKFFQLPVKHRAFFLPPNVNAQFPCICLAVDTYILR